MTEEEKAKQEIDDRAKAGAIFDSQWPHYLSGVKTNMRELIIDMMITFNGDQKRSYDEQLEHAHGLLNGLYH